MLNGLSGDHQVAHLECGHEGSGDAREEDGPRSILKDDRLRMERGVDFADTRPPDDDLASTQPAAKNAEGPGALGPCVRQFRAEAFDLLVERRENGQVDGRGHEVIARAFSPLYAVAGYASRGDAPG